MRPWDQHTCNGRIQEGLVCRQMFSGRSIECVPSQELHCAVKQPGKEISEVVEAIRCDPPYTVTGLYSLLVHSFTDWITRICIYWSMCCRWLSIWRSMGRYFLPRCSSNPCMSSWKERYKMWWTLANSSMYYYKMTCIFKRPHFLSLRQVRFTMWGLLAFPIVTSEGIFCTICLIQAVQSPFWHKGIPGPEMLQQMH